MQRRASKRAEDLAHYRATQAEGEPATLPPVSGMVGPCRLIELLGEGGAGRVYRAHHERLDFEVALKVIAPNFKGRSKALERFTREARVAARLNHPNIARVYDVDEEEGTHYIIQELVRGESLEARVARKGPLRQATAVGIGATLASGLASIHQAGVVHRDLKPSNVILTRDGMAKLIDFGIAKDIRADSKTHQDVMLGTPRFMAPEQATAKDKVGPASDVFGLGCTLYFALTGRAPHEPEPEEAILTFLNRRLAQPAPRLPDLRDNVHPELADVIEEMLANDPAQRPPASEVHELLERIQPIVEELEGSEVGRSSSWRLAAVSPADAGTQGQLSDMPLIEILQGIEFNEKSGELEVRSEVNGEPFTGRLTFRDGQPHEASTSTGLRAEAAVLVMLALEEGSFLLRKEARLEGPAQIQVSFTRLVLDHTRQSDESERLPVPPLDSDELMLDTAELHQEVPEAKPSTIDLARSGTMRLHKAKRSRRSTKEVSRAVLALEERAVAAATGDPFLGCDLGPFHADALVEVDRGERRYLATVKETGERAFLRVFPLSAGIHQQEFRKLAERAAGPLTLKGTRLEPCLGGGSSRDAFYAGYLPASGNTLLESIALRGTQDPFSPEEVVHVLGQLGLALQALHSRNMVHGNVSPKTIRLEQGGESVVLTRAGMGRVHPAHRFLGRDGAIPGEVGFVAPEVLDAGKLTPAADLYSLGCVAWTLLTGHHPFGGGTELDMVRRACSEELPPPRREDGGAIPRGLATIVSKLAGRHPKQRYTNANEFLTDLAAFERGKDVAPFRKVSEPSDESAPAAPVRRSGVGGAWFYRLLLILATLLALAAGAAAIHFTRQAGGIPLDNPLKGYTFELDTGAVEGD